MKRILKDKEDIAISIPLRSISMAMSHLVKIVKVYADLSRKSISHLTYNNVNQFLHSMNNHSHIFVVGITMKV